MKKIFKLKGLFLLGAISLLSFKPEKPLRKKLEEIAREYVSRPENFGIAVGIIYNDEEYKICLSNHQSGKEIDTTSIFEIGSITKVFTSLILADEASKGNLKLTDNISPYLPVSPKDQSLSSINFLHLATHSSGLPRLANNFWSTVKDPSNPYISYSQSDLINFLANCQLERSVGQIYEYSNLGAGLLGYTLALKNKTTYENLVQDRVCKAFNMNSTSLSVDYSRVAAPHAKGRIVKNWDFPDCIAAQGGLKSNVSDMTRFVKYCLYPEKSPLKNAILLSEQVHFTDPEKQIKVGLGWHIGSFSKETYLEHNGGTGGYRSYIGLIPSQKIGVVVLSNSENPVDETGIKILRALMGSENR
jgi:serine-type D-Ala-D-Ala carboxypeptidase/endopeptidase